MPIQPSPYRWLRAGISRLHGRFASGAMLVALLLLGAMSSVRGGSVTIQNPSFETGGGNTADYSYQLGLFNSWTYSGRAGIASNGSPWFAAAAPDGTHAAFIQTMGGASSIAQTLTVPAGTYVLTFKAVARTGYPSPDLSISFAGATIATYSASTINSYGETWTTYTTNSFVVSTAGDYELKFTGLPLDGSDRDVAIDQVSLNGSPPVISTSQLLYETTTPNRDISGLITYTSGYGLGAGDAAEKFRLSGAAMPRIRYRMELNIGNVSKFAEASFDTWQGATPATFSIPDDAANKFILQRNVTNLAVTSNVSGVTTGSGLSGRLEIWPYNYTAARNTALAGGSDSLYDTNDTATPNSNGHGSFQVHNLTNDQTVLAWNRHRYSETAEIGFGNAPSGNPDWTLNSSNGSSGFKVQVWVDSGVPAQFAVTEDVASNLLFSGTPFADPDSANLTVTLSVADGTITGASGTGITIGGTAIARTFAGSVADLNTYFTTAGKITYQGALNSTASRTLTTTVADEASAVSVTSTINIVAVDDAPTTPVVPAQFSVTEDVAGNLTYTGTPFADIDSTNLTVTLAVADGTITGAAGTGITVGGTVTARTFAGTVTDLNTYFTTAGKITYQGSTNNTVSRTLTTTVSDGTSSVSATSTIAFIAVSDAPTLAAITVTGAPNTTFAFTTSAFTNAFSSVDGRALTSITVTALPSTGSLQLFGVAVAANQVIAAADLAYLTYVPATGATGSVTFQVKASDSLMTTAAAQTVTMTPVPTWIQGDGNWDTTTANWSGTAWTNGSAAVFAGAGGSTVTVAAAGISAPALTFKSTGYTIAASGANTLSLSGSPPTISVGSDLTATISAPIAGAAGLTSSGEGTLKLTSASNTYTGTTTVAAGRLRLSGAQTSTAYSVTGGILQVDAGAGGSLPSTAALSLGVGFAGAKGKFIYDNAGASGAKAQTLASLTTQNSSAAENIVQVTRSAPYPVSLTITSLSNNSTEIGNIVNFVTTDTAGGGVNGTDYKIVLADQGSLKISKQNAYFNGSDFAVYDTTGGFVRGIKYGTDPGTATSAGGASFSATTALEITGSITAQPTVSLPDGTSLNGSLKIVGASNLTMLQSATLTISETGNTGAAGLLKTGGGKSTISGGNLFQFSVGGQNEFRTDLASDVLEIAMPVTWAVNIRNMKSGAGTLIFSSGAIPFTDHRNYFSITDGTLEIGGSAYLNTTGSDPAAIITGSGAIFRHSSTVNTTVPGVIQGLGGVEAKGSGRLILSGANSYRGGTTIASGGVLQLGAGGTTGSILGNVTNNGSLILNRADQVIFTGAISGAGSVTMDGTGTCTLQGDNSYTGATTVNNGSLGVGSRTAFGRTSQLIIASGAKIELNGNTIGVAGLKLGGLDKAAGTYSASTDPTYLTGSGSVVVGTPPGLTVPATLAVTEDVVANVVFSATAFSAGTNPALTVTLSVSGGSISALAASGITLGGSAANRTFQGSASALNTYFSTAGNVTYLGATNSNADQTLTTTVSDGVLYSSSAIAITIAPVNDAPVAANGTLTTIAEDVLSANNAGTAISTIVSACTDVDTNALKGMAITAVSEANGAWFYTTDGGSNWASLTGVSETAARLLKGDDANYRVRFVPNANYNGTATFTFRAWDQTSGAAGQTADVTTNGGGTAYSSTTATATITITAVNDAPTLTTVSTLTGGHQDVAFEITYAALAAAADEADVEGDAISFRVEAISGGTLETYVSSAWSAVVPGSTLLSTGGKLRWTPLTGVSGTQTAFTIKAFDGTSASSTAIPVTVALNASPQFQAITPLTITDTSANDVFATLTGTLSATDADTSTLTYGVSAPGSIVFNSSKYLTVPTSDDFMFGTGDFTIETWAYVTSMATGQLTFYDSGGNVNSSGSFAFWAEANILKIRIDGGNDLGAAFQAGWLNNWVHYAVVRRSGTITIFVNGVAQVSGTRSQNITNKSPYIGELAAYGYYLNGKISNYRIVKGSAVYSAAFTPSTLPLSAVSGTVLLLQTATADAYLTDSSGYGRVVTNNGGIVFDAASPFSQSVVGTNSIAGAYGTLTVDPSTGAYSYVPNSPLINSLTSTTSERLLVTVSDGGIVTMGTLTVNLVGTNDNPTLVASAGTTAALEQTATAVDSGMTVVGDSVTPASATVAITGGFQSAEDVLSFTNVPASHGNIVGSYDSSTGVLTLTSANASATLAQWQAALRAVTYTDSADNPNLAARTVSWKISGAAFDSPVVTKTVSITAVNDAPVAASGTLTTIAEDVLSANNSGTVISTVVSACTDPDASALKGLAVTAVNETNGTWYYSINGGTSWLSLTGVSTTAARLLKGDDPNYKVRFVPNANYNGTATFTFQAWDQTSGTAGGTAVVTTNGGTTAYSSNAATATITVTPVNDAPNLSDGSSAGAAAASAMEIKNLTGTNTNGVYWIKVNGVATQVYCIMDSAIDGGGWMLAMKGASGAATFGYSSAHWTTTSTLNPTYLRGNSTTVNEDAKFDVFNYTGADKVMAIFPDVTSTLRGGAVANQAYGFIWIESMPTPANTASYTNRPVQGTYTGKTLRELFAAEEKIFIRDATATTPYKAAGTGVFSTQTDVRFFGFNYKNANGGNGWNKARFGFGWNENGGGLYPYGNETSNDVSGGIGLDRANWSAGDYIGCCQNATGVNRSMQFELYVKVLSTGSQAQASSSVGLSAIAEDVSDGSNPGTPVSALTTGFADPDANALKGLAVTAVDEANGKWFYTSDGGTTWLSLTGVSETAARLLSGEDPSYKVRFVPNANFSGTSTLTFRAWDQTSGTAGQAADVSTNGGSTAFSAAASAATITVTAVNDAPVAANGTLSSIDEDVTSANNPGTAVSVIVSACTDVDVGAVKGLAVTAVDETNGAWFYTNSGGTTWLSLTGVSPTTARLLKGDDANYKVRFVPNANYNGTATFTFRAWDQTSGAAAQTADVSTNGGSTAYSAASATATITINSVNDAPTLTINLADGVAMRAATGGTVIDLSGNKIHKFTSSGTFTPAFSGQVEVLVVGGGGGGAPMLGGGGGGGGVVYLPAVNVVAGTSYSIVVGAGGAAATSGQASTAFGATAAGGGTSGSHDSSDGTAGGSGGGAASNNSRLNQGGLSAGNSLGGNTGTIYGNRGGNMTTARAGTPTRAAGGGGAGGQGKDTNSNVTGDTGRTGDGSGGVGVVNSILGTEYFWAAGGGGGAFQGQFGGYGGLGGGGGAGGNGGVGLGGANALSAGADGIGLNGGAGGPNTGGGGGGGAWDGGQGGAGGSGIVVVRYVGSGVSYADTSVADTFANYTGQLTATDAENDSLTFGITNGTAANGLVTKVGTFGTLVVNATTGAFAYTPDPVAINLLGTGVSTSDVFSVTVTDGKVGSPVTSEFRINVTGSNDTPTLTTLATLTGGVEDTDYTITYAALAAAGDEADPDNATVSFRVEAVTFGTLTKGGVAVVPGTTVLGPNESLVWRPANNSFGTLDAFTVKAWDGTAASATAQQVKVEVAAVNDAPTLTAISVNGTEDTPLVFAATDFTSKYTDVEGIPLVSLTVVTLPTTGTLKLGTTPVTAGQVIVAADLGTLTYVPALNDNGAKTFTVKASDGELLSAAATVTINVAAVNDAPVLGAITVNGTEGKIYTFAPSDFTSTYSDVENTAAASITIASLPASGTLKFSGTAVTVGQTISLSSLAAAPTQGLVARWSFDSAADLAKNAITGDSLTNSGGATWVADGRSGGALSLNGSQWLSSPTGTITGLPVGSSNYTIALWFKVASGATWGANGFIGWGNYGTTNQVNAFRLDGNTRLVNYWWGRDLSASVQTMAASVWYHVAATYNGTTRTIYLNGQQVGSDTLSAPNVQALNFGIGKTVNQEYFNGLLDEVLIYSRALSATEIATMAGQTSALTYEPATNEYGVKTFTVTASDGALWSAPATVSVNLAVVNQPPVLAAINVTGTEDTPVALAATDFTSKYTDREGMPFTSLTVATLPATGTLKLAGAAVSAGQVILAADFGNLTYVPALNENGNKTFTVKASDGDLLSTAATVTITLAGVNDAPVVAASVGVTAAAEQVAVAVDGGLTVADVDSPMLASATVSITGGFQPGQDVLGYINAGQQSHGNIAGSYDAATGVLTLISQGATATLAQWQAALRAVTYTNTVDVPNVANRTVSFQVNDGALASNVGTKTVAVTAVNDAPVLAAVKNVYANAAVLPIGINGELTLSEQNLVPAGATVVGVNLSLEYSSYWDAAYNSAVAGCYVKLNGADVGGLGWTGIGTNNAYVAVNRSYVGPLAAYLPGSTNTWTIGSAWNPINVRNVRLVVYYVKSGTPALELAGTEDTPFAFTATMFTDAFKDIDSAALVSVTVATLPATGTLKLSGSPVTAGQVITVANLGNLTYVPAANETGPKTFTVTVSDGQDSSAAATVTINLAAVNDAPTAVAVVGYRTQKFTASGTFVPQASGTVEYLIVGGGGGGGAYNGGGGAGGLLTGTITVVAGQSYPVVVGAGGLGESGPNSGGSNGGDSSFNGLVAKGGGKGSHNSAGASGGSGGGSGYNSSVTAAGVAGQGNSGGAGMVGNNSYSGGGGGGAGGPGGSATATNAGAAGPGVLSSISGTPIYYAVGGPGSSYRGGDGARLIDGLAAPGGSTVSQAGVPNTGNGGGGGITMWQGMSGGSGVVILKYADVGANSPTIVITDTAAADVFSPITGSMLGTDVENDPLAYGLNGVSPLAGVSTQVGRYGTLAINQATGEFTFTPDAAVINALSASASETFTLTVSDGTNVTPLTLTISIVGVNDTPTLTVPAAQAATSAEGLTFGAQGRVIQVGDVDDTNLSVTLAASTGTLTLGSSSGLTFTQGNGAANATMTFNGPIAALNTALATLRIDYPENFAGNASIGVTVKDAANATATGQIAMTVTDSHAPRVLALSPVTAAGHYRAGSVLDLQVTFSEPVVVTTTGGVPTLKLATGDVERTAVYAGGSQSDKLTFRYTVQAGDTSPDLNHASTSALELNGGMIRDGTANAAVLTLPATAAGTVGALATNAQWVIDTTAPTVTIGSPSLTKTDSGPVTFAVTYADLNGITPRLTLSDVTLIKTGDAAGVLSVAGSGTAWTVTISNLTGDGTMAIALAAGTAADPAGNLAPAAGTSETFLVENILPVKITAQPVAVSANQGDSVRFAVTTTGRPAATYQWRKAGVAIPGATLNVLALHGVVPTDAESYDVIATNIVGPVTSSAASLTVTPRAGDLFGAGLSQSGSLGDLSALGNLTKVALPLWSAGSAQRLVKVAAQSQHTLVLAASGKVYGIGSNYAATLGIASNASSYAVPELVLDNVRQLAVAEHNSYFLRRDGTLWGTGVTADGMVGEFYPGAGSVVPFALVPGVTDIVGVWAGGVGGDGGCLFLRRNGDLYLLGSPTDYEPRRLATGVVEAAQGEGFRLWITTDGMLWAQGDNTFGQLGTGNTQTVDVAKVVAQNVARVVAGPSFTFFIKNDGALWAMGRNTFGQLGLGTTGTAVATPVKVAAVVTQVAAGARHAAFIKADGTLWAMGSNYYGQLGDGSMESRLSPVKVADNVLALAAGDYYSTFLAGVAPRIEIQPVGRAAVAGESISLSVAVSGTPVLNYVWKKDGVALSGATLAVLTLPNISNANAGLYEVEVANEFGSAISNRVGVTVSSVAVVPTITVQPVDRVVQQGTNVSLTVEAAGSAPLRYQWRKGGTAIAGATDATFALASVQFANVGTYDVVVSNTAGSATSAPAALSLTGLLAPEITTQPKSQYANPGSSVTLSVVANGSGLSYQWYKQGVLIAGETRASLSLASVQTSDAGVYWVVVSNAGGSVTSDRATLTVDSVLGSMRVVGSPVILSTGGTVVLELSTSFAGSVPVQLGWSMVLPPGFSYAGGSNEPDVKPLVGNTGTVEWAYFNIPASGSTFRVTLAYGPGIVGKQSIYATLLYRTNALPTSVTLPPAVLSRVDTPVILKQPTGVTVVAGLSASLSVSAQGGDLSYQWFRNGEQIAGATTATLNFSAVALADAGDYKVRVTNTMGSVDSNTVKLAIYQVVATQATAGTGYVEGQTLRIINTITFSGGDATMGWQTLLPSGWTFVGSSGDEGDVKPVAGTTDLLEWAWTGFPISPVTFTYTVNVPAGSTGPKSIASMLSFVRSGAVARVLATPDPLVVMPVGWHSADTSRDGRIDIMELLRVIELYNTRHGTVRTGAYQVGATTEDGFAADFDRDYGVLTTLTSYHSADSNRDGRLSLLELLRVIELFSYAPDRVRTGQYHRSAETDDGFASGP